MASNARLELCRADAGQRFAACEAGGAAARSFGAAPQVRLAAEAITLRFGGVVALDGVSLNVRSNELLAIIGPNGAGKSSLLNCLSGFYRPQAGRILVGTRDISRMKSHAIAAAGVARTFQHANLLSELTVLECLMVGRHTRMRSNLLQAFFSTAGAAREEASHREKAEEILELLDLQSLRERTLGTLGYGLRKRVDLARALAMEPAVLLMDEPMAGMNAEEKESLARCIVEVRQQQDIAVVLVEHDMGVVMDLADRIAVLDFGRLISEGTPAAVRSDARVVEAYLGKAAS
jgi:branched-chain amino acid transport system ATP-binding protein